MSAPATATIHAQRDLPHAPALVWRALTEPALLARWWAAGEVAPVVGHRYELDMGQWGRQPCEVLEVEPGLRLVTTFGPAWTLTWTVEPTAAGARLVLAHGGFDLADPRGAFAYESMGRGWSEAVLPRLDALLAELERG